MEESYTAIECLSFFIDHVNQSTAIEDIEALFVIPKVLASNPIPIVDVYTPSGESNTVTYMYHRLNNSNTARIFNMSIDKVTSYDDYTPKNNKCFCYPYNYLKVTNNIGSENILKYEMFKYDPFIFDIECAVSIGCSIRCVPRDYKGTEYNYDETLPLAKYPTGAWTGDAFTNWLTKNSVDIIKNLVPAAVVSAAALATMNPVTIGAAAMSSASSIGSILGGFRDAKLQSPIERWI